MKYYIGIDVGTSSTKALAYDEMGRLCCSADHAYEIIERHP